jgi:hypothetical protein
VGVTGKMSPDELLCLVDLAIRSSISIDMSLDESSSSQMGRGLVLH